MTTTALLDHSAGYVTDGGLETDLIFHHGVDLPEFAAFPLLDDPEGRRLLRQYYDGFARIAAAAGTGLLLESPTWRANPDWGARVGYDRAALERVNVAAMRFLGELAECWRGEVPQIRVVGMVGPRGDGYLASDATAEEAYAYHLPQLRALAAGGADFVSALTLTGVGEALGIGLAAREVGLPAVLAFTVETDGRLPAGTPLADAIEAVDAVCAPAYFGVNCAHPTHIESGLAGSAAALHRIALLRVNASALSHAELDEAEELDDGDPAALAEDVGRLRSVLPDLRVIGGCCGTDARHVAAMWSVSESAAA